MSSKLKAKPRKQKFPLAQSNQAAQAFGRAMQNCHSQIKSMEKEAYENGFNDGILFAGIFMFNFFFGRQAGCVGLRFAAVFCSPKEANKRTEPFASLAQQSQHF